ncbi:MAG: CBS domain-containing protein [Acetobacteraceae bacterium]
MTVAAILKRNGFQVAVVAPADRIRDVVGVVSAERGDAALVVDPSGQWLGIIAEHDIVKSLAANGAVALEMTAGQLVTRAVRSVTPHASLSEAMRIMIAGQARHLAVIERGECVGLISLSDVVRARVIEEQAALAA